MKKFTLLFLLLSIVASVYSQELSVRKERNGYPKQKKTELKSETTPEVASFSSTYKAGSYLQQSAMFQYGAIGGGIIAGGLAIAGSSKDNKGLKNAAYIIGGMAIISEIFSIHLKMRAGKELKLSTNGTNAAISMTF